MSSSSGPGDFVAEASGLELRNTPSIFTVQCSETCHVQPEHTTLEKSNHSCEPNCEAFVSEEHRMFALRAKLDMVPGEIITFDYETTEWSMESPFKCCCGTPTCRGTIQGFKHMKPELQIKHLSGAADHIQRLYHAEN
jgi:hypothetical protein